MINRNILETFAFRRSHNTLLRGNSCKHICRHKESTRWLIVIPFEIYLESFPKAIHFFSFLSLYITTQLANHGPNHTDDNARKLKKTIIIYIIMSLIISRVIFHYFLYLSNMIISHEVHLLSNYTFPTQELIFESFALPSLENTIGTISPFLFAINHRKCCSKRHLKNITLLNIDLCACVCVCACLRVCVLMNNKTTKE